MSYINIGVYSCSAVEKDLATTLKHLLHINVWASMIVNGCKLELVLGDISKQETEVIVNAANDRLEPGGGTAGAIHRAAGIKLWEECRALGGCKTGAAKITKAYNLAADYVIHTVGPIYTGSPRNAELLASCYIQTLQLARRYLLKSIAFPAISTGTFGYPMEDAAHVALATVVEDVRQHDALKLIRFVLFTRDALIAHRQALQNVLRNSRAL